MQTIFSQSTNLDTLAQDIEVLCAKHETKSLILLGCDENNWSSETLTSLLHSIPQPLIGGIFPQVVYGHKNYQTGYILIAIGQLLTTTIIDGLNDDNADYEDIIVEKIPDNIECQSMLVFVDGLSDRIGSFLDGLFAIYGANVQYLGGGAGSLSFEKKPCVMTNQGIFEASAAIALLDSQSAVNVGHGWEPLKKGYVATSVEKNIIKEIDYKNALDVYESSLQPYITHRLTESNFFEFAQSFPIGIKKIDGEYIVRDPITITADGHLVCVGEISEGDHIDILRGSKNALINAAKNTSSDVATKTHSPDGVLLIDCISRALFLKDDFHEEIIAVACEFPKNTPLFGALVLGEIANSGSGYLEFYNKTTVVALI